MRAALKFLRPLIALDIAFIAGMPFRKIFVRGFIWMMPHCATEFLFIDFLLAV